MKVLAINGSPRRIHNTAQLLQFALEGAKSEGAETEMAKLAELHYRGCISCFACKLKDSSFVNACAVKDDLSPLLEKAMKSDVLIFGSPIYLGDVTGMMRNCLERLIFMNISYDKGNLSTYEGNISSGFIYTMNVTLEQAEMHYRYIFEMNNRNLQILKGHTEYMLSTDTYQFDDYSQYNASRFDEGHKSRVREKQFPLDCERAFQMGKKLAGMYALTAAGK